MYCALDLSLGNLQSSDQAGQKSKSHILVAIFKRTGAISPDFSLQFTASRYQMVLRGRRNKAFLWNFRWEEIGIMRRSENSTDLG